MSTPKCAGAPAPKARPTAAGIELAARRFAVLAEPTRLRLPQALFAGEKSVGALVAGTGGTQTNVSRHLQTLMHEQVISRRKEGRQVFYAIADPSIRGLREQVCGAIKRRVAEQAEALTG